MAAQPAEPKSTYRQESSQLTHRMRFVTRQVHLLRVQRGRRCCGRRSLLVVVTCIMLYCLLHAWSDRSRESISPVPRHVPASNAFGTHFEGHFLFQVNSSVGGEAGRGPDGGGGRAYPRLPDDWPEFFLPRPHPVFSLDDLPYLQHAGDVCRVQPHLLMLIVSAPGHSSHRQAIRDTWGGPVSSGAWSANEGPDRRVVRAFLLGDSVDEDVQVGVVKERELYGDIVQWDGLVDSYYSLTLKILLGLRWAAQFCPGAGHVLKADDDIFVHVPRVLRRLSSPGWADSVCGSFFKSSPCERSGKYAVTRSAYPFDVYPPHVKGNLYVLPASLVPRLVTIAPFLPYNNMEDVHVTGTLARALHARHESFTRREFPVESHSPAPCSMLEEPRVGAQRVSPALSRHIWTVLMNASLCNNIHSANLLR